jgi:hypothetical protein
MDVLGSSVAVESWALKTIYVDFEIVWDVLKGWIPHDVISITYSK